MHALKFSKPKVVQHSHKRIDLNEDILYSSSCSKSIDPSCNTLDELTAQYFYSRKEVSLDAITS